MSYLIDIDARRITGASDGDPVTTIVDNAGTINLSVHGVNAPSYSLSDETVVFDPVNSESLSDTSLASAVDTVLKSRQFFLSCRASAATFGSKHYTVAMGSSASGNPIVSLLFGPNDPNNTIRDDSGFSASPNNLQNLMVTGQLYTIYLRGDGTDVYFGVDDPDIGGGAEQGGTREIVLTDEDLANTTVNQFCLGALVRDGTSYSGNVPINFQAVHLWDGAVDATTRDTLLSEIASGMIGTGPSLSITDPIIPGTATSVTPTDFVDPPTGARITDGTSTIEIAYDSVNDTVTPPALGTQSYVLFGDVTLELYNAEESATTAATLNPPAAYEYLVTLPETPSNLTNTGYLFNWSPDNGYEGVQVIAPFEINSLGDIIFVAEDGVYPLYAIDDFDGEMQGFTVTIQDGEVVSVGRFTRRNLTRRTFTRRSLTARP